MAQVNKTHPNGKISQPRVKDFQKHIFVWWEKNRRDLPWRKTDDPYKILVSEIMLQQTQVSRVVPKYQEFLQLFPDVSVLSRGPL
jgi:A/G-specific adenine glycosylase